MNIQTSGQRSEARPIVKTEQHSATVLGSAAGIAHGNTNTAWIIGINLNVTYRVGRVGRSQRKGPPWQFAVKAPGRGEEKSPFAAAHRGVGNFEHRSWRRGVQTKRRPARTVVSGFVGPTVQGAGVKVAVIIVEDADRVRIARQGMGGPTASPIGADTDIHRPRKTDVVRVMRINGGHCLIPDIGEVIATRWTKR